MTVIILETETMKSRLSSSKSREYTGIIQTGEYSWGRINGVATVGGRQQGRGAFLSHVAAERKR